MISLSFLVELFLLIKENSLVVENQERTVLERYIIPELHSLLVL